MVSDREGDISSLQTRLSAAGAFYVGQALLFRQSLLNSRFLRPGGFSGLFIGQCIYKEFQQLFGSGMFIFYLAAGGLTYHMNESLPVELIGQAAHQFGFLLRGKQAGLLHRKNQFHLGGNLIHVLPSLSAAAAGFYEALCQHLSLIHI